MTDTEFATQAELETAGQTAIPLDILDHHLHSFFNAYTKQIKTVGYPVPLNPGGGYVLGGSGEIAGYNITAHGASAVVTLHDGADNSFSTVLSIVIPADESVTAWYLPGGVHYERGLSLEVTGTITGNVFVAKDLAL